MLWDRAVWAGPPDGNYSGSMVEVRGLIVHIAEGSYQGTISWQRNPVSDVSSHFVHGLGGLRTGEVAQMLDTSITAWTQGAGNGRWVSVENAGFHYNQFTAEQIEAMAQLYAWLMATHGCPPQLADGPNGRGLGWHGMGGAAWGGHPDCPGPANVALLPTILARAIEIANGDEGDDMQMYFLAQNGPNEFWLCDGMTARGPLQRPPVADEIADLRHLAAQGMFRLWKDGLEWWPNLPPAAGVRIPWTGVGGLVPHTHDVPLIEVPAVSTGPAEPSA